MKSMTWYGFGFNAFEQICRRSKAERERDVAKIISPVALEQCCCSKGEQCKERDRKETLTKQVIMVGASWSRRVTHIKGDSSQVCLSGFDTGTGDQECRVHVAESRGCTDVFISERYLTLSFVDRIECWSFSEADKTLAWKMEQNSSNNMGCFTTLPLVQGGYIATKPPFFKPLSPQLHATNLMLGAEHAILLTNTGSVYTWGSGSHGQLGHGGLVGEEEPRVVEALWGVPMKRVAAGGWHTACISAGGDLYMWGWNEIGQLGLPSNGLMKEKLGVKSADEDKQIEDPDESSSNVFISIQAFPALVDIQPESEICEVSCGSRHTAAISSTAKLYTWGWGQYGQLGHGSESSTDKPTLVDFFSSRGMCVEDVVCGQWNTFVSADQKVPSTS